jgi:pimeloyl-ACP methyl ester carboxylesterase
MLVTLVGIGRVLLVAYAVVCVIGMLLHRKFIYMPTPLRPGVGPGISLISDGVRLRITTRFPERVVAAAERGELAPPGGLAEPGEPGDRADNPGQGALTAGAVIYFGGNAEEVDRSADDYAAAFPRHAIYLMNYRGYGGSQGSPSEAALHRDAAALYEYVASRHGSIVVIGRSLGSGVAVRLAVSNRVDRLILITPFDSIVIVARGLFPFLPLGILMRDRYDSYRYAPRIAVRTLVLAAEHDEIIPPPLTDALCRAFSPERLSRVTIEGADHNDVSQSPNYWRALREFVAQTP